MAKATRSRGPSDTARTRQGRVFVRALAVALVLHAPLFPSRVLEWVRVALFHDMGDYDDADAQAIVPIDLDLLAREPVAETAAAPPAPAPAPVAKAGDGAADAGAPPPPKPRPEPTDAGPADAGPPAPPPLRDPMAAAGGAGKIAAQDANIQLLVSGSVLRKHEIGAWASRVLLRIPQWREFFSDTAIDPIRDLNHLLITAPRFRSDSSKLVAIMETNASADTVRDAVDQVVHRANGVWLEDAPVTAARARVDGAPRLFALLPEKRLLVILPGDATDLLERVKHAKPFRNSAEGLVASLITPARPLASFISLPDTLKWLRVAVVPTADGGLDLAVEAGDRSSEDAERHTPLMNREIERFRKHELLGLSVEIFDPMTCAASGDTIRGRTHVPRSKLGLIMAFLEQLLPAAVDAGAMSPGP